MSKGERPTVRVLPESPNPLGPARSSDASTASSALSHLPVLRLISEKIEASILMLLRFEGEQRWRLVHAVDELVNCFKLGGKVLVAGNGGSAAEAQHFAGELVGRFQKDRDPLPVIALSCNSSVVTAIANDYGYDRVFSRQVQALGRRGDVLVAISTSGTSANMLAAVREAKRVGMRTIGFLSERPGELTGLVDIPLQVPATDTPSVQEGHTILTHLICALVEQALLAEPHNFAGTRARISAPGADAAPATAVKDT